MAPTMTSSTVRPTIPTISVPTATLFTRSVNTVEAPITHACSAITKAVTSQVLPTVAV